MHACNQEDRNHPIPNPNPNRTSISNTSSTYPLIPLYFSYVDPTLSLLLPPFAPIHLIQSHLAHPPATLRLLGHYVCRLVAVTAAGCAAFRRVLRCGGIDVFTINVLSLGNERASAIASACVALFQAEELQFGVDEVEKMHGCRGRVG